MAPTAAPTQAPGALVLQTATLLGSLGFVAVSGKTAYVLSADRFNVSNCTAASGCIGLWPIIAPPAGVTLPSGGFSSFVRSDGQTQLAFNGNPLYTYAGDTSAGQTTGNGITSFGGVWTIGRPSTGNAPGSPVNPQPTSTPPNGSGY